MLEIIFQFHALETLHQNEYDIAKSLSSMIPEEGPVLCRDEMEEWSPGEPSSVFIRSDIR